MRNENDDSYEPRVRRFGIKHILIIIAACIIAPIAAAGWTDLYRNFIEGNPPTIVALESPRGLGLFPVTVRFRVSDADAGLDEIVIRLRQKSSSREIRRIDNLKGKKVEEISVEVEGESSKLAEGLAYLEVKAFDRSFWSNVAEASLQFKVDYRKPRVEVLSTQHNARIGGSQLVLYKAFDEDLAVSGIKVGNHTFLGFPATALDKDLNEGSLFAAIYGLPLEMDPRDVPVKVFAEDRVGNAVSATFYNKVSTRTRREQTVNVDDQFIREKVRSLADNYRSRLQGQGEKPASGPPDGMESLAADFKIVNEKLRAINDGEVVSVLTKNLRNEGFWKEPFFRQIANATTSFSDLVNFQYDGALLGSAVSKGEDLSLGREPSDVLATNGGIVVLSEDVGIYGWTVAIDHGLGVSSVYSYLDRASVNVGEEVARGQPIGTTGNSGFGRRLTMHFEIRVQGVPVDPREWWEASWFQAHILGKVNDLKRSLGIPVYTPIG